MRRASDELAAAILTPEVKRSFDELTLHTHGLDLLQRQNRNICLKALIVYADLPQSVSCRLLF